MKKIVFELKEMNKHAKYILIFGCITVAIIFTVALTLDIFALNFNNYFLIKFISGELSVAGKSTMAIICTSAVIFQYLDV